MSLTLLTPQEIGTGIITNSPWLPQWASIASSTYATAGTNGSITLASLPYATKAYVIIHGWYTTNTGGTGLNARVLLDGATVQLGIQITDGGAVTVSQPTPLVGAGFSDTLTAGSSHTLAFQVANQGAGTFGGLAVVTVLRLAV